MLTLLFCSIFVPAPFLPFISKLKTVQKVLQNIHHTHTHTSTHKQTPFIEGSLFLMVSNILVCYPLDALFSKLLYFLVPYLLASYILITSNVFPGDLTQCLRNTIPRESIFCFIIIEILIELFLSNDNSLLREALSVHLSVGLSVCLQKFSKS